VFSDPHELASNPDRLERIEKATLRSVTQAMFDFKDEAVEIFENGHDLAQDMGEDATREALDRMGTFTVPKKRLFGKIDYKRARYVFFADYAVRQALFVDSKAEKGAKTATIQMSQTSMRIRQRRGGATVNERGKLPLIVDNEVGSYLVTTVLVKYDYSEPSEDSVRLRRIYVLCIPNGMLQGRYNPSPDDTFWLAGRNAPSRGEDFRVRVSLPALKRKATWRVQEINPHSANFRWDE
jgi:hypothetical protein